MSSYAQLRAEVAALVAAPGAVTRAKVHAVLERNPSTPAPPESADDVFDDDVFDPHVFG